MLGSLVDATFYGLAGTDPSMRQLTFAGVT
jgi:hypothetical protein